MPFYYGGCEGNGNNFDSLEDCQKSCPSQFLQMDVCEKPQDGGPCGDYEKRYTPTPWIRCEISGFCLLSFCQNKRTQLSSVRIEESVFIFQFLNDEISTLSSKRI